ncbi:protein of unknown function [Halomicrobium zhouii]|uniref:Protein-glutamine gamma-glutamyltransferase-like C-terminal domain-containing protein n=1 Tax=Halomicrobium zhouii TaxID=767519 RepID=A0A1I6KMV6_9EURY|nr:DUF4129 domain-containing protein [Halomicrobium zhouii]SFR92541.1 protein of unknown function [Halomicrobium zhouii]
MARETVRNVALAVCGVLAVTLTAATLPTAFQPERSGSGGSGSVGTGEGAGQPSSPFSVGSTETVEITFLTEIATLFVTVVVLVALWYLFVNRRRAFRIAVGLLALGAVGGLLAQFFRANPERVPSPSVAPLVDNATAGGAAGESVADPSLLSLVVVAALTLVCLAAVVTVRQRSTGTATAPSDDDDQSTAAAAVGRAAGRAAERIETGDDLDNEVYRAWREMTSPLDVSRPETTTAGEFEAAAVDAGMDPGDVRELTDLFEGVRYGGRDPEPADEERAVALLRRIEDQYAEVEP